MTEYRYIKTKRAELDELKKVFTMDDHHISWAELTTRYPGINLKKGLSNTHARRNLEKYGINSLTPQRFVSSWIRYSNVLFNDISSLIWMAALLLLDVFGEYYIDGKKEWNLFMNSICLVVVMLILSWFCFYQEKSENDIMKKFTKLIPKTATVIRNGQKTRIRTDQLVIGDLVQIRAMEKVPADIRLSETRNLTVDNSCVTKDLEPQFRTSDVTSKLPLESKNIAFCGTTVVTGAGKGIVIRTGDRTVLGHTANMAAFAGNKTIAGTSLEVSFLLRIVSVISICLSLVLFFLSIVLGYGFTKSVESSVICLIAAVPEGLVVIVTLHLRLGARGLDNRKCHVNHLAAAEMIGSISVICTEKTGILTVNKMEVSHLYIDDIIHEAQRDDTIMSKKSATTWRSLGRMAALCNNADFSPNQDHIAISRRMCVGGQSDVALLKYAQKNYANVAQVRARYKKVFEIPFTSSNEFTIMIFKLANEANYSYVVMTKGSSESIIDLCSSVMIEGKVQMLDHFHRDSYMRAYLDLGNFGEKVLAFSQIYLSASEYPNNYEFDATKMNFPLSNHCLIGLMSLCDPPQIDVVESISKCKLAGIKVVMVTTDHPITAKAFAKSLGIISEASETVDEIAHRLHLQSGEFNPNEVCACILHGNQLKNLSEERLDDTIRHYNEIVFARTTSHQKLQVVEAFQRLGAVVAVTGEGINDAPALKRADVGICLGNMGSDVAKQSSDVVLLDDSFSSLVKGIEYGRLLHINLKKGIVFLLASNVAQMAPIFLAVIYNMPQPMSIYSILYIDLIHNLLLSVALVWELPEQNLLSIAPRNPKIESIISSNSFIVAYGIIGLIEGVSVILVYFMTFAMHGFLPINLIGVGKMWDDMNKNDLLDSIGQEWTYEQRKLLLMLIHSNIFATINALQWGAVFACRTQKRSLMTHGVFSNYIILLAMVISTVFVLLFTFLPVRFRLKNGTELVDIIGILPSGFEVWVYSVIIASIIWATEEGRKWILRRDPGGWLERETLY